MIAKPHRTAAPPSSPGRDEALLALMARLKAADYRFVTPGNATIRAHRRRREDPWAANLRDVLGWSLPFRDGLFDRDLMDLMRRAGVLRRTAGGWRSTVRASSVGGCLFFHSAFPTSRADAVFLGPDTYRYVRFLRRELAGCSADLIVDVGAGSGAGGVIAGLMLPQARVVLTDVNRAALRLAQVNARAAGVACACREGPGLQPAPEAPDLVIANPPFIADRAGQVYQDGGEAWGAAVSAAWAEEGMRKLRPGGRMLLYTGSAIIKGGDDPFRARLAGLAARHGCRLDYDEIDPDIFGDELRRPAYAEVERIAAVGAVIHKLEAKAPASASADVAQGGPRRP